MNKPSVPPELLESNPLAQVWRSEKGTMVLRWTERGVIGISVQGHGDRGLVPMAVRRTDALLSAHGSLALYYDFWHMPTYDSEMRSEWTAWASQHRPQVTGLHVLQRSKFVAMGVSVANLALGGLIRSYTERRPFLTALRAAGLEPAPDP